ncbi:hypothetical protein [Achromobacter marplatensis]|jgi:ABC-type nitrate/sulfonate/bicarbonate transport system permease component|uniref:hypothetical protein n=1 Tax=Achromobacter marplatensis TaxID=470868 RepID=UPI0028EBEC6E|nr:hypothetical protein [Achromobacter marplatensis]
MAAASPSHRHRPVRKALVPWVAAAGLLALWQLASLAGWPLARDLPAPSAVLSAAVSAAGSGELWAPLRVGLWGAAGAALLGAVLGGWQGVRTGDRKLIEMGRSVGLAGWPLWRDVILPGALPTVLSGARLALALFWVLRVTVDIATTGSGSGHAAFVPILLYALLALATDALVRVLARHALRWDAAFVPDRAGAY